MDFGFTFCFYLHSFQGDKRAYVKENRMGQSVLFFIVVNNMANEQNLRTPSTEEARAMQKKSAAKRSQNIKERKLIKDRILERMGESDWDTMIDNLIARAQEDTKSFECVRDTIGEKPTDKMELDASVDIVVNIDED